ncbi:protein bicaudal D [Pimephales promelas]|nr:protein bicaudal D [Pimephales promelas]
MPKSTEVLEIRMQAANEELAHLRKELKVVATLKGPGGRCKQEKERWRARQDQERIGQLEREIGATRQVATDSEGHLSVAQEELLAFSERLANLYIMSPSRENAQPFTAPPLLADPSACTGGRVKCWTWAAEEAEKRPLAAEVVQGLPTLDFRDPTNVRNLVAVIRCQIKHTRWRWTYAGSATCCPIQQQEKALIQTYQREQIATLRTVLKANKQTAELALTNLKTKYETEKCIVAETMMKLRNELKALKEDAATFSSLRVMFASRYDGITCGQIVLCTRWLKEVSKVIILATHISCL